MTGPGEPKFNLIRELDPRPWTADAACAEANPDAWFPDVGESNAKVKQICRSCVARVPCLTYALDNDERFGIWGATTPDERQKMRKRLRRGAA